MPPADRSTIVLKHQSSYLNPIPLTGVPQGVSAGSGVGTQVGRRLDQVQVRRRRMKNARPLKVLYTLPLAS
jgi:hypothetical protein